MTALPIDAVTPAIREALREGTRLILQAPPGAGKTTRVPLALLDESWLGGRTILMLEPRRLAARAAAARMAELTGEDNGQTIGYRVRFDSRVSARTRIEVLTEGILTRRLQHDPALAGVGLVIFDEFHERSLHADLALALCLESQTALREDLRLLVMSATLDGNALAHLLAAPVIESTGHAHPVAIHYAARDPDGPPAALVARAVPRALVEHDGDILAFLPGGADIRRAQALLAADPACAGLALLPLYGDLSYAEQSRAILPDPQGRRKVVLATPIAETSLTIEGVSIVVDSGWERAPRFDPGSGLTRLETQRIAQDSAVQRAGRAGRMGPGVCHRLWSEATQRSLAPRRAPEILSADLAPLALELAQWGADAGALQWLTPPPAGALAQARELLTTLDALDQAGHITPQGRRLADWPLHPRLAHMVLRGAGLGLGALACDLAALLEERDILRGNEQRGADVDLRLTALRAHRDAGKQQALGADPAACARVERAARQWRARLGGKSTAGADHAAGLLLAFAFPDRIAQRRADRPDRYLLANGRGARLAENDPLQNSDWLVAAQLDAGQSEGRIHLAAGIDRADIESHFASHIASVQQISWDPRQQAVIASAERRLGALLIERRTRSDADPEAMRQALIEGIQRMGLDCLPWTEAARQWQARVLTLGAAVPEELWPDATDVALAATLDAWLGPHLHRLSRREHLQRLDLLAILQEHLDWRQRARLEQLAPTHLPVPSGSRIRLRYAVGAAPVLAVKLQELFGLADTPRIADGQLTVVLHLLSPAQRPIQVTQDLRSFWNNTYPEVKKELKGRYPKHPWPDDPWNAPPTRRLRPRG